MNKSVSAAIGLLILSACSANTDATSAPGASPGAVDPSADEAANATPVRQTLQSLTSVGTTTFRGVPGDSSVKSLTPEAELDGLRARAAVEKLIEASSQHAARQPPPTQPPTVTPHAIVTQNDGYSGFDGLNAVDSRKGGSGGTPPDQGMCVGNGLVLEAINSSLRIFSTLGAPVADVRGLTDFFHFAPSDPANGHYNSPSDPKCYYDRDTDRWFITVLKIVEDFDKVSGQVNITHSSVEIAVSTTTDPSGGYNLYSLDLTDDGTNGTPHQASCPCLGDQPLIGADAHGFYISTNEFGGGAAGGFNGAQIYALSKTQLVAGHMPTVVHLSSPVLAEGIGYSVQPAVAPSGVHDHAAGGTEYFVSSLDFTGSFDNRIALWALTNTSSLASATPHVNLVHSLVETESYGQPPPAAQKDGPTPLRDCVNAGGCTGFPKPASPIPLEMLDGGDDRMMQVMHAGGRLWSALNTVVNVGGQTHDGIAWFAVKPHIKSNGRVAGTLAEQGYVAVAGNDVTFPSIAMTDDGRGALAFTLTGHDYYPSAAYALVTSGHGIGDVHIGAAGQGPQDDFSGLDPSFPVARWGDYTSAATDGDTIWLASEYIAASCPTLTCAGRTRNTNYATFVSRVDLDSL